MDVTRVTRDPALRSQLLTCRFSGRIGVHWIRRPGWRLDEFETAEATEETDQ